MANQKTFKIEGARLMFRNFAGKGSTFNREGERNFAVVIPMEETDGLAAEGWNVKWLEPREEGEEPLAYIQVKVRFDIKPPNIFLMSSTGRTKLGESTIESLDWLTFTNIDLICSGYNWEVGEKRGMTAYLKTMYAEIEEDDLDRKYAKQRIKTDEED